MDPSAHNFNFQSTAPPPPLSALAPPPTSSPFNSVNSISSSSSTHISPPPPHYLPHPRPPASLPSLSTPPQYPLSSAQTIPRPPSPPPVGLVSPEPCELDHSQFSNSHANANVLKAPLIDDQLSRDFPELANLGKEDLQDLLNDPEYFHAIFFRLGQVQQTMESHQGLIAANQVLAEKNLALRPQLERLRDEAGAAFSRTNELQAEFAQLLKDQADLYIPFGESASRARLLTALHESDKITERLAAQFADEGLVEEDEFVKEFREERTKYHKRAWVADRWAEGSLRWD